MDSQWAQISAIKLLKSIIINDYPYFVVFTMDLISAYFTENEGFK
jgi:hypothetical protein